MTPSDGSNLLATESAALMNGGWNLFRRPRLTYDGQPLHVPEKYCGHLANIPGLAEYSEDYERAGASSVGFFPDTADGSTSVSPILINTAADVAPVVTASLGGLMAQVAPKFAYGPNSYKQGYYDRSNAASQSNILSSQRCIWLPQAY